MTLHWCRTYAFWPPTDLLLKIVTAVRAAHGIRKVAALAYATHLYLAYWTKPRPDITLLEAGNKDFDLKEVLAPATDFEDMYMLIIGVSDQGGVGENTIHRG